MTSIRPFHKRLLKLERRSSEAQITPKNIVDGMRHAEATGEQPEDPELANVVSRFLGALAAIELVQEGIYEEEYPDVSQDSES